MASLILLVNQLGSQSNICVSSSLMSWFVLFAPQGVVDKVQRNCWVWRGYTLLFTISTGTHPQPCEERTCKFFKNSQLVWVHVGRSVFLFVLAFHDQVNHRCLATWPSLWLQVYSSYQWVDSMFGRKAAWTSGLKRWLVTRRSRVRFLCPPITLVYISSWPAFLPFGIFNPYNCCV